MPGRRTVAAVLVAALICALFTGCGGKPPSKASWWHIYFTDPGANNGTIVKTLVSYINSAKTSIHIAAFEFNLTPVADALVAAKKRGVDVKWVTDDEHGLKADKEKGRGQFALLQKAGIPLKDDGRQALMHNKFIVIDGKIAWTGSTNLTVNDTERNNNNVIVFDSSQVANIFERQFAELWAGKFDSKSPSEVEAQKVTVNGTPIQVLFSPEDDVASRLLPVIQSAKRSIRFMAFSFTDDNLGDALKTRAKAGVDVKGIFETRGSETQYSELPMLFCAKVPVRQDGNPGTFHHKVFVIDNSTVITGSYNFSRNADKSNSENAVILTNPSIATEYTKEFERRWAEAKEPAAAKMKCR
ncbi:MAG: phospholipase D-like domain-containing protein [Oscillatoria sp. Prado101]|nr:phospholipase D-like domain-containing protein [Oscillatoria sp. Prado101]